MPAFAKADCSNVGFLRFYSETRLSAYDNMYEPAGAGMVLAQML
jgi:hypothetical protein